MYRLLLTAIAGLLMTAPAFAQSGVVIQVDQGLTDAVLAKPVSAEVTAGTISDVFRKLAAAAGVKIQTDLQVQHILPGSTRMPIRQIRFANVTLKAALDALCVKFGLTYKILPEKIWIEVAPQLVALGRRVTIQELIALSRLRGTRLPAAGTTTTLEEFLALIDGQLKIGSELTDEMAKTATNKQWQLAGGISLAAALDKIAGGMQGEWAVPDGKISMLTYAGMAKRKVLSRLAAPATVHANAAPLYQVLTDLGRQAGVTVFFQPGALLQLPEATRERFTLRMRGATVQQAFETIAGVTGLGYDVNADGVTFGISPAATTGGHSRLAAMRRNPMVALMRFKVGAIEMNVPIRKNDLPEAVYQVLLQRKQQYIQQLGSLLAPAIAPPNLLPDDQAAPDAQ